MGRKIKRFFLLVGDIVALAVALLFAWLDLMGVVRFPCEWDLPTHAPTYIVFVIFAIYHLWQRYYFAWHAPKLRVVRTGWQRVSNGERLYIAIHNNPDILSPQANSLSTGALVTLIDGDTRAVTEEFEDVRWQGTSPPVVTEDHQPYDYWAVDIPSGRRRWLYVGARADGQKAAYLVSDRNYGRDGKFTIGGTEIPEGSYLVVKLWSSGYEYEDLCFVYKDTELTQIKMPKEIRSVYKGRSV